MNFTVIPLKSARQNTLNMNMSLKAAYTEEGVQLLDEDLSNSCTLLELHMPNLTLMLLLEFHTFVNGVRTVNSNIFYLLQTYMSLKRYKTRKEKKGMGKRYIQHF